MHSSSHTEFSTICSQMTTRIQEPLFVAASQSLADASSLVVGRSSASNATDSRRESGARNRSNNTATSAVVCASVCPKFRRRTHHQRHSPECTDARCTQRKMSTRACNSRVALVCPRLSIANGRSGAINAPVQPDRGMHRRAHISTLSTSHPTHDDGVQPSRR